MRQDPLGGDWSDGLNAWQLQEVILEEKGSVCRVFTHLAVLTRPHKHELWLPASQLLGLPTASVSAVMPLGVDKTSLRGTLELDRRSSR